MAAPAIPATKQKAAPNAGQRIAVWWTKSVKNLDLFDENAVDKVKTDPWYMLGGAALLFWYDWHWHSADVLLRAGRYGSDLPIVAVGQSNHGRRAGLVGLHHPAIT